MMRSYMGDQEARGFVLANPELFAESLLLYAMHYPDEVPNEIAGKAWKAFTQTARARKLCTSLEEQGRRKPGECDSEETAEFFLDDFVEEQLKHRDHPRRPRMEFLRVARSAANDSPSMEEFADEYIFHQPTLFVDLFEGEPITNIHPA